MKKWILTKDELPDTIRPVIITWKNKDPYKSLFSSEEQKLLDIWKEIKDERNFLRMA